MAHQWFGDLVTMDWWDDLWLNEGFASWMELKATDQFHPEWKVWLDSQDEKEGAMRLDARSGTHPIIQPIIDVLQANEAFDSITYSKGQAVIRMLENYVGADAFRAGVRNYIKAHAYGNTVTDDLWRELDKTSPRPVTAIAHDFTLQPGVPLIRVAPSKNGVRLSQDRFAVDATGGVPLSWRVPVLERSLDGKSVWRGVVQRSAPVELADRAGVMVNEGQAGYFRTLYDPALLKSVAARFRGLSAEDQLGVLNDSRALGYSGYEPLTDFLSLAGQADPSMDAQVLDTLAGKLQGIDYALQRPARPERVPCLRPEIARSAIRGGGLGCQTERESECDTVARFVARCAWSVRRSGDVSRRRANALQPTSSTRRTWPPIRAVRCSQSWRAIPAPPSGSSSMPSPKRRTSTLAKRELYTLLGTPQDKALARQALDLALTSEPAVTTRPDMIASVGNRYPDMAFDFVNAHLALVNSWLEADSRDQYAAGIAANSHDAAMIEKLKAFAKAHIPDTARGSAIKAESAVALAVQIRAKRLPDVDHWLNLHATR